MNLNFYHTLNAMKFDHLICVTNFFFVQHRYWTDTDDGLNLNGLIGYITVATKTKNNKNSIIDGNSPTAVDWNGKLIKFV